MYHDVSFNIAQMWILVGVFLSMAVTGFLLVTFCLGNVYEDAKNQANKREIIESLRTTLMLLRNRKQCLLVPLTIFTGLSPGFIYSTWMKVSYSNYCIKLCLIVSFDRICWPYETVHITKQMYLFNDYEHQRSTYIMFIKYVIELFIKLNNK